MRESGANHSDTGANDMENTDSVVDGGTRNGTSGRQGRPLQASVTIPQHNARQNLRQETERIIQETLEERMRKKNIIIIGMDEGFDDMKLVRKMLEEIGCSRAIRDIDRYPTRLGSFRAGRRRPLKVEFNTEMAVDHIMKYKKELKGSMNFYSIFINRDLCRQERERQRDLRRGIPNNNNFRPDETSANGGGHGNRPRPNPQGQNGHGNRPTPNPQGPSSNRGPNDQGSTPNLATQPEGNSVGPEATGGVGESEEGGNGVIEITPLENVQREGEGQTNLETPSTGGEGEGEGEWEDANSELTLEASIGLPGVSQPDNIASREGDENRGGVTGAMGRAVRGGFEYLVAVVSPRSSRQGNRERTHNTNNTVGQSQDVIPEAGTNSSDSGNGRGMGEILGD